MIVDLFKLKRSGKQSEDFLFDYSSTNNLSFLPDIKLQYPVKVKGTVTLTGEHSAYIDCEIDFTLFGPCTRCLEETEKAFIVFAQEECDSDSDYKVINDKIDLDKIVEDTILINMPANFLCKDDCKGICPGCGVNLNKEKCKCKNE